MNTYFEDSSCYISDINVYLRIYSVNILDTDTTIQVYHSPRFGEIIGKQIFTATLFPFHNARCIWVGLISYWPTMLNLESQACFPFSVQYFTRDENKEEKLLFIIGL